MCPAAGAALEAAAAGPSAANHRAQGAGSGTELDALHTPPAPPTQSRAAHIRLWRLLRQRRAELTIAAIPVTSRTAHKYVSAQCPQFGRSVRCRRHVGIDMVAS